MWIICLADDSHEMPSFIVSKEKEVVWYNFAQHLWVTTTEFKTGSYKVIWFRSFTSPCKQ